MDRSFQFTPPCGGGLQPRDIERILSLFQFTPPCGGEPIQVTINGTDLKFQFTPPCGGGPALPFLPIIEKDFNSRPRVGAGARRRGMDIWAYTISIHAPVWGRAEPKVVSAEDFVFQFTPPCGGGLRLYTCLNNQAANFNSRPRVGAGLLSGALICSIYRFQFTPPCGGGLCRGWFQRERGDFNSRPRVGAGDTAAGRNT